MDFSNIPLVVVDEAQIKSFHAAPLRRIRKR